MNNFDLGRMLMKFTNTTMFVNRQQPLNSPVAGESFVAQTLNQNILPQANTGKINVQMNTLQSIDMAVYAREIMQLPRNLNELIFMLQKGLTQAQFNSMFSQHIAAQKNALSQMQAQILAQLQGLTTPNQIQTLIQTQLATQLQSSIKNLALSPNGMISLAQIAQLIQTNGKEALTKLITAMATASKQGINDLSQIKEMARLINASMAAAAQNEPAQTLKILMLLYLPWLPLEEGVGFDLEVESKNDEEESDSILTITISTVNYGTILVTLILETSNSVHVSIECSSDFPKEELLLRIQGEEKNYSMNSIITFTEKEVKTENDKAKAKVNMSQTTEINPFMLLMAHAIIRHTIEIDNNKSIGITSHID